MAGINIWFKIICKHRFTSSHDMKFREIRKNSDSYKILRIGNAQSTTSDKDFTYTSIVHCKLRSTRRTKLIKVDRFSCLCFKRVLTKQVAQNSFKSPPKHAINSRVRRGRYWRACASRVELTPWKPHAPLPDRVAARSVKRDFSFFFNSCQ